MFPFANVLPIWFNAFEIYSCIYLKLSQKHRVSIKFHSEEARWRGVSIFYVRGKAVCLWWNLKSDWWERLILIIWVCSWFIFLNHENVSSHTLSTGTFIQSLKPRRSSEKYWKGRKEITKWNTPALGVPNSSYELKSRMVQTWTYIQRTISQCSIHKVVSHDYLTKIQEPMRKKLERPSESFWIWSYHIGKL